MLQLYNSLTQQKEQFTLLSTNQVTLYVCGITPYDTTHLGHAFTYLSFDVLVRYLEFLNYKVTYTQNVTDINDRDNDLLKKAQEQHTTWEALGAFWTKRFLDDMTTLNWRKPDNYLYASQQIPSMTVLIEKILQNGFGYEVDRSVYLDIAKVKDFGKLSRLNQEQMLSLAKDFEEDLTNPDKRNPLDITLWRATQPTDPKHIPGFDSPWGKGRPGWHIECSAMAINSLGEQIDIHGGGNDLIYPHHESEIAQSESATLKKPFARVWMHTGSVYQNGQKMSKSLGNITLVSELLKTYSPNAIRWVLLSHHYREAWEEKEEEFKNAEKILYSLLSKQSASKDISISKHLQALLNDDLNVPEVLRLITTHQLSPEATRIVLKMLGFTL